MAGPLILEGSHAVPVKGRKKYRHADLGPNQALRLIALGDEVQRRFAELDAALSRRPFLFGNVRWERARS